MFFNLEGVLVLNADPLVGTAKIGKSGPGIQSFLNVFGLKWVKIDKKRPKTG
jgi:hypothetical protein